MFDVVEDGEVEGGGIGKFVVLRFDVLCQMDMCYFLILEEIVVVEVVVLWLVWVFCDCWLWWLWWVWVGLVFDFCWMVCYLIVYGGELLDLL